jgi:hypothetical protein
VVTRCRLFLQAVTRREGDIEESKYPLDISLCHAAHISNWIISSSPPALLVGVHTCIVQVRETGLGSSMSYRLVQELGFELSSLMAKHTL